MMPLDEISTSAVDPAAVSPTMPNAYLPVVVIVALEVTLLTMSSPKVTALMPNPRSPEVVILPAAVMVTSSTSLSAHSPAPKKLVRAYDLPT